MGYSDQRIRELTPVTETIPYEALKLIAQSHTSEINLRCVCVNELCLRAYCWEHDLPMAIEDYDWADHQQKQAEVKSPLWWSFDEYLDRLALLIERLKDEAVKSIDPHLPIDQYISEVIRIDNL